MGDDIITFGVPSRGTDPGRDADVAIETLFHACYPRLVRTGYALVGDWDLAEQLAQEAYLRLWRRWRWISDPQAAPAYLQRTVVNLCRETIRRRVIERRVLRTESTAEAEVSAPDAAELVELRRAIATLPSRKRECVVLRYLLGLSEAETAGLLGISVGTVKSQTHKGLAQLKERLAEPAGQARPHAVAQRNVAGPAGHADRAGSEGSAGSPGSPGGTVR